MTNRIKARKHIKGSSFIRTHGAMMHDALIPSPEFPTSEKLFLSTLPADVYTSYKAGLIIGNSSSNNPDNSNNPQQDDPKFATVLVTDIVGANNVDNIIPPDNHGAVGRHEFVEVTNEHITIIQKDDPSIRTSISLASFFGYFAKPLTDPRVIFDIKHDRWVVTADAFPESVTVQFHFIGISKTRSALGPFFINPINVTVHPGDVFDFPQLGMDRKSIIVTANIFNEFGRFKGADMFAIGKDLLYEGHSFSVPIFEHLEGTLAPPIVLDHNDKTFLVAAPAPNDTLKLYKLEESSRPHHINLTGPIDINVDPYDIPPPALQPGTLATIDTLDGRFVNASTQIGNHLWQVHTINLLGFVSPRFYKIDTHNRKVINSGPIRASDTSFDFNASIVANKDNDVFLTWTSTDPSSHINTQVRFSGFCHKDHNPSPSPGQIVGTSLVPYTFFRWGDYSSITIDPSNKRQAWLVNEAVDSTGNWFSHIGFIDLIKIHRHH